MACISNNDEIKERKGDAESALLQLSPQIPKRYQPLQVAQATRATVIDGVETRSLGVSFLFDVP